MKCGLDKKELRDPDGGVHLARKKAQLGILEQHIPDCTALFLLLDLLKHFKDYRKSHSRLYGHIWLLLLVLKSSYLLLNRW